MTNTPSYTRFSYAPPSSFPTHRTFSAKYNNYNRHVIKKKYRFWSLHCFNCGFIHTNVNWRSFNRSSKWTKNMNNTNVCAISENMFHFSWSNKWNEYTTAREKLLIYTVVDNWNEFWSPIISETVKINRRYNHIVHFEE